MKTLHENLQKTYTKFNLFKRVFIIYTILAICISGYLGVIASVISIVVYIALVIYNEFNNLSNLKYLKKAIEVVGVLNSSKLFINVHEYETGKTLYLSDNSKKVFNISKEYLYGFDNPAKFKTFKNKIDNKDPVVESIEFKGKLVRLYAEVVQKGEYKYILSSAIASKKVGDMNPQLWNLLEGGTSGIIVCNKDGYILNSSPTLSETVGDRKYVQRIFNYNPEELYSLSNPQEIEVSTVIDLKHKYFLVSSEKYYEDGHLSLYYMHITDISTLKAVKISNELNSGYITRYSRLITHDISSQVAIIGKSLGLLRLGTLDNETKKLVDYALSSVHNIKRILKIASVFKEIAISKDKKQVNLYSLVEEIKTTLINTYKHKEIDIVIDDSCDLDTHSDTDIVHQIFYNILENSIKHINKSYIFINIYVDNNDAIVITDNGPRIEPSRLKEILNNNGVKSNNGSGLGISLVRLMVYKLGWSISFHNSDKSGLITKIHIHNDTQDTNIG